MKFIKKIPHIDVDISLYEWNQKYILKFEHNQMEQIYKVSQLDIEKKEDVETAVTPEFVTGVMHRFAEMQEQWDEVLGFSL